MDGARLTEKKYWDRQWEKIRLPVECKKRKRDLHQNEILEVIDKYLPKDKNLSILEIGGAPGGYLAYMYKNFGYNINSIDYSDIGCAKTMENLNLLNMQGNVYKGDIFSEDLGLPLFDIVYSMGFVEHFSDLDDVIESHLKLLRPGGILLIGVPNLLGINYWFSKRLAPDMLSKHNLDVMDISNWKNFEDRFKLEALFKGYCGGFEPGSFIAFERITISNFGLAIIAAILYGVFHSHFKIIRRLNSKHISGYAIGIYRKGAD